MAEANPVSDLMTIDVELEAYAYLATLEQRSSEMVQLETRLTEEQPKMRPGLVLAVAAFAAVIVIGLVTIFNQGDDTPPPATEPTPTTQAVQETTATTAAAAPTTVPAEPVATTVPIVVDPRADEAIATATAFIEALIVGDLATADAYALGSVALFLVDGGGVASVGPAGELPWKDALGWEAILTGCAIDNPGGSTIVVCSITNSTDISRILGVEPYASLHHYTVMYAGDTFFGQEITETTVVSHGGDANTWETIGLDEFKAAVFTPFMTWLEENHRDDLENVMWHAFSVGVFSPDRWLTGDFGPDHAPESIDLWGQYSDEYIAQLDA